MSEDYVILSSDNDNIQVVESTSRAQPAESNGENSSNKRKVTLLSVVTGKEIFTKFLEKCRSVESSDDMETIINNKLWKRFNEASEEYTSSRIFIALVEKAMLNVSKEPYTQMKILADELKYKKVQNKSRTKNVLPSTSAETAEDSVEPEMDPKTSLHIKKLEKVLKKLHLRIQKLEDDEVDLDSSDDENSSYVQVSRYKEKFCQVFKKLCELQNKDPHAERPYRKHIKFNGTNIPAVDKAIEKFYNDRKEFPDYRDILTVVQKANEVKKLNLSPYEVDQLAVKAFLEFGKTLKTWRQYDDYEIFSLYSTNEEDPANQNDVLKTRLEENKRKYANRIDEVIDKYASKQTEENLEPEVVNSDAKSSESEDEEEEEDPESDCRNGSINLDESGDNTDVENTPGCRVMLVDVKCTPEWEKYMQKKINTSEKNEATETNVELLAVTLEKCPPWLSHKRSHSSENESPSHKKLKTADLMEPIPSTSKQSAPIKISGCFQLKSNQNDSKVFKNKAVENEDNTEAKEDHPSNPANESQMSVDNDNDVIEIVSDSCDKVMNIEENNKLILSRKQEKSKADDISISSKKDNENSNKEAMANDLPSATSRDEIIKVDVCANNSESHSDVAPIIQKSHIPTVDICVKESQAKTDKSSAKPSDDIIPVEDAEEKNESNDIPLITPVDDVFSIDVCSKDLENKEKVADYIPRPMSPNVISVDELVESTEEENQSQECLIDMPLEVVMASDPLADNSESQPAIDNASLKNLSKENEVVNIDESESIEHSNTANVQKKSTFSCNEDNNKPAQSAKDNEDDIMIIDEIVKSKTPEKSSGNKNEEVIDVEEIADSPQPKKMKQLTLGLAPINISQIIRNMNFDKNIGKRNFQPTNRLPIPSTSQTFGNTRRNDARNIRPNSTMLGLALSNQGTSKQPTLFQPQSSNFNSKNVNRFQNAQQTSVPSQRRPLNNQFGTMKNIQQQFFSNNKNVTGQSAQAALHKRQCTTHTLQQQRYDKKTNCMVTRKQITTVVEESVMKISNTQMSNGNFQAAGQRSRVVNRRMQQVQRSTRSSNRNNPVDEIITLD